MKTLRSILAIAILALFAACDDAEFDKAIIDSEENSSITCQLVEDGYSISWQPMTVRTNKGTAMYRNYYQEYMVCVSTDAVNYVNVKTVTGLSANVSLDEVSWALNGESVGSFYFGVRLSNSNHVYCTSSQISRGVYVKCDVIGGGSVSGGNKYYDYGETVILTAEPNTGCIFMGWSDGSTDKTVTYKGVSENITITATFADADANIEDRVLKINTDGNGYVKLRGKKVEGEVKIEYGESVELEAVGNSGFTFYQWSDGSKENPRIIYMIKDYDLTVYFKRKYYELEDDFSGFNKWFLGGDNKPTGHVEDYNNIVVNVGGMVDKDDEGIYRVWNDNLEIVLNGLTNQEEEKDFLMMFKIKWEGKTTETAGFRICSGADKYFPQIEGVDKDWDAWVESENTEILFDSFKNRMGETFVVGSEPQPIKWGGKIGDKGAKYIGIEINLAGYKDGSGDVHENGRGTFTITDMHVLINKEPVW